MDTRDSIRYWAGALGAAALVAAILVVVVMVRMPTPKTKPAQQVASTRTQAAVKPQAAAKPPLAAVKPPAAVTPPAAAKPQAAVKPQEPVKPATAKPEQTAKAATTTSAPTITAADRKISEELWAEQKKLDADGARAASLPNGGKRVAETIGKQFNAPEKLVTDLRARKLGYGEIAASLALSQQLMKRDKVSRQQALDTILGARKSGQGWAALSKSMNLKIADVLSEVRKTDAQVAKLATLKAAAR
jgi:type IV secretory pathway VirB10-like protein